MVTFTILRERFSDLADIISRDNLAMGQLPIENRIALAETHTRVQDIGPIRCVFRPEELITVTINSNCELVEVKNED